MLSEYTLYQISTHTEDCKCDLCAQWWKEYKKDDTAASQRLVDAISRFGQREAGFLIEMSEDSGIYYMHGHACGAFIIARLNLHQHGLGDCPFKAERYWAFWGPEHEDDPGAHTLFYYEKKVKDANCFPITIITHMATH